MAVVYSDNVIEISVVMSHSSMPTTNVWHMWFDAELGTDTMTDVVGDFRDNWQDHIMNMLTDNVTVDEFRWLSLDEGRPGAGSIAPDPLKPLIGGLETPSMPPNVAQLVKKNTSDRPRGRRDGRSYLPGVAELSVDAQGLFGAPDLAGRNGWLADFYNGISDTSGSGSGDRYPCVLETTALSRDPDAPPQTIGSRRVTSLTMDPRVATQRDRLR